MDKTRLHIINRITRYRLALISLVYAIAALAMPLSLYGQCFLACNDNLEVSLNQDGFFVVTPALLLQGNLANCPNIGVELFDQNQNFIGNTLTCAQAETTVTGRLIDYDTNTFCDTDLNVKDMHAPVFTCLDIYLPCNAILHPDSIGYPSVIDNCTSILDSELFYSDHIVDLPCGSSNNGIQVTARIERTWLVSDDSGNQGQCVQNIYLERATLGDVVFPSNLVGPNSITCGTDDPNDFNLTGVPLIAGREIDPNGFCDISILYNDQVFNSCGGSTTTFRKWLALDDCTTATTEFDQIIELRDKFGPEITCPADISINAASFSCDATVSLPVISGTDECSGFNVVSSWAFGTGSGPFVNVPVGQHTVTYIATDACNNTTTCTMEVNVMDNTPPTPICENSISVSLLPSGDARVFAATFDEGSFDNCAMDRYEVRRDTQAFGPFVNFTCADVMEPFIMVQLRVYDANGLHNDCWIEVTVNDNFAPIISCPGVVSIDCQDDITDLNLVGAPNISDACGVDTFYYSDIANLNCGVGTIERTWTAVDVHGNSNQCVQTIQVEDNSVLQITYPENVTIDFCSSSTDTLDTGVPVMTGVGCKNILVNMQDQTFTSSGFCYTIFRTWTVIDWCVYDPNSGSNEGEYTHTQRIDVLDFTAPEISCVADTSVLNFSSDCSTVYIDLAAPTATDCSGFAGIRNNSPFADDINGDASGYYPNGTHTIEYIAFDNCGNTSTCQQTITVEDGLAPNLFCESGLVVEMPQNGSITIDPQHLLVSASDNCTPTNLLTYTLVPNTFTCSDIGANSVTLIATDLEGNSSACTTTIDIQDNMFACSAPLVDVSGRLTNVNDQPIPNREVVANGVYFTTTDANGNYSFQDLPAGQNYSIQPMDVAVDRVGITTFDLVLTVAHLLQTRVMTDPYKIISADVNNTGSINIFDLLEMRQMILLQIDAYSSNTAWKFVDAAFSFIDSSNPFADNIPSQIVLSSVNQDVNDADFVAIKLGDVDGDGSNLTSNNLVERSKNRLSLFAENVNLQKDEVKKIAFNLDQDVSLLGLQFDMIFNYDLVEFISLGSDQQFHIGEDYFEYDKASGSLRLSSDTNGAITEISKNEGLFFVEVRAKVDCKSTDLFDFVIEEFNAELYSSNFEKYNLELDFEDPFQSEEAYEKVTMSQNYPNPVLQNTFIEINSEANIKSRIRVTNILGQEVFATDIDLQLGKNIFELNTELFSKEKIMFYSLEIGGELVDTKKMIMVCP